MGSRLLNPIKDTLIQKDEELLLKKVNVRPIQSLLPEIRARYLKLEKIKKQRAENAVEKSLSKNNLTMNSTNRVSTNNSHALSYSLTDSKKKATLLSLIDPLQQKIPKGETYVDFFEINEYKEAKKQNKGEMAKIDIIATNSSKLVI